MIEVDFDEEKNLFVITCPFAMNEYPRGLSNKKYSNKHKAWLAPALRLNREAIATWKLARLTSAARAALAQDGARKDWGGLHHSDPVDSFRTRPLLHQMAAIKKLAGCPNFALFMDMGTGKTKTAIDLFHIAMHRGDAKKLAIVAPLSVLGNWEDELRTHAGFEYDVFRWESGAGAAFNKWCPSGAPVFLVGVESLSAGGAPAFLFQFVDGDTMMVVDESHKIKNYKANRTQEAMKSGEKAAIRGILTGTPIARNTVDLYAQFNFLNPDIIGVGDFFSFRNRYCIMGGFNAKQIIGFKNTEELTELLAPFIYQVKKEQVFNMPPKTYQRRAVVLPPENRRWYDEVRKKMMAEWEGRRIEVKLVLTQLLRLSEVTAGIRTVFGDEPGSFTQTYFDAQPKLDELMEVLEELPDTQVVIWCRFRQEIDMVAVAIGKRYPRDGVVQVHGGIKGKARDGSIRDFQSGHARYLVANPETGGVGINLQNAHYEVFMSNDYSLINRMQAEDRLYRKGQTFPVTVIDIVAEKTIDDAVLKAIREKKEFADYVAQLLATKELGHSI